MISSQWALRLGATTLVWAAIFTGCGSAGNGGGLRTDVGPDGVPSDNPGQSGNNLPNFAVTPDDDNPYNGSVAPDPGSIIGVDTTPPNPQGGNPQGGNPMGGNPQGGNPMGGGNDCDGLCKKVAACPSLMTSESACAAQCASTSSSCKSCIKEAGSDCDGILNCVTSSACQSGGQGQGGSGQGGSGQGGSSPEGGGGQGQAGSPQGQGGGSSGQSCAQLAACCPKFPAEQQSACSSFAEMGNEANCSAALQQAQSICGG